MFTKQEHKKKTQHFLLQRFQIPSPRFQTPKFKICLVGYTNINMFIQIAGFQTSEGLPRHMHKSHITKLIIV